MPREPHGVVSDALVFFTMVDESMAHFKTAVQDQLAEFLGCRWVTLYPTAVEALYALQDSVLGPPIRTKLKHCAMSAPRNTPY